MSRACTVLNFGVLAGILAQHDDGSFRFTYDTEYLRSNAPAISLTMPKRTEPFESPHLFPFFDGLLSEGTNRALQLRHLRIDSDDRFGLLVATAGDTIGSVTVESVP